MKEITRQIRESLCNYYNESEVVALTRILATELLDFKESLYFLKEPVTLSNEQQTTLQNAIEELQKFTPIQYILGYEYFCGLRFKVDSSVLIPRPETQELVTWITDKATGTERMLDIGTGSGCIAISLAHRMPKSSITAWDISNNAISLAQENNSANNTNVLFAQKDILSYIPGDEQFDIIVSNPPYIKEIEKRTMEKNVLDYEPHIALFVPNEDPLLFYRVIAQKAQKMLTGNGALYFEINRAHGNDIIDMLRNMGYQHIELRKDFADNDRMIKAIKR